MGRKMLVVVAVVVALGAAACVPSPTGGPVPVPPSSLEVTYQLTGTCVQTALDPSPGAPCDGGDVDITFTNASGVLEQTTAMFPYTLTLTRRRWAFVYVSGENRGNGTVSCQVTSGGRLVQTATSTGDFVIASCSGSA